MAARSRRAVEARSTSASITIRPEMMCNPPAKRSMADTSALRTEDFLISSWESSCFTDAVSAMAAFLPVPENVVVRRCQTQRVVDRPAARRPYFTQDQLCSEHPGGPFEVRQVGHRGRVGQDDVDGELRGVLPQHPQMVGGGHAEGFLGVRGEVHREAAPGFGAA